MFNKIIDEICEEEGIKSFRLADNWIHVLEKNGKTRYMSGYKFDLNGQGLGYIIDDKYAFYELLVSKEFPSIKYYMISDNYDKEEITKLFNEYNKEVVVKDNFGTCGKNVYYVNDIVELFKVIDRLLEKCAIVVMCPFYKIKTEYRSIVVNNEVKLVYGKKRPIVVGDGIKTIKELLLDFNEHYFKNKDLDDSYNQILEKDKEYQYGWQFNLSQGSIMIEAEDKTKEKIEELATDIIKRIGISFGSIDIIELYTGEFLVMEANSGVMMDNFILLHPRGKKIAKEIYVEAIRKMFE